MSGLTPQGYFVIRNELADSLLKGSHQLAGVPEPDRRRVLHTALEVVPEAAEHLRPYPVLYADGESSASRLAFSCLSAAATFPDAAREQIIDLAVLTMILFGIDDIADGVAGPSAERDHGAIFAALPAILGRTSRAPAPGSPVEQILAAWSRWCDRFHGYAGAASHLSRLSRHVELVGEAMGRERAWAEARDPWPSYADYLANGVHSITYPVWWVAALAVCGPEPAREAHWASIEPATHLGAACMRLANDIRTFEREKAEGKPNSISILQREGLSTREAVARVTAHIDELDTAFRRALAGLPAELAGIAAAQIRSVSFNGRWYLARDTHAYTVGELADDARTHVASPR